MIQPPAKYGHAKWDDVPKKVQDLVKKMNTSRKGLYIHGGVGTGKTHMVWGILAKFREKNMYYRAYSMSEFFQLLRHDIGANDAYDNKHTLETVLDSKKLLFFDDIGTENVSPFVMETLFTIVNKRYEEQLPVVYTSNLSISQLAEKLGDRIVSRIIESCDIIEVDGVDKRMKKPSKYKV